MMSTEEKEKAQWCRKFSDIQQGAWRERTRCAVMASCSSAYGSVGDGTIRTARSIAEEDADDAIVRFKKYKIDKVPSVIVGTFGKGRAVVTGPMIGLDRQPREYENAPTEDMLRFFLNAVMWASGRDAWDPFDIVMDD